jgi:uncharacterized membrane protein YidH (DUF202 family)
MIHLRYLKVHRLWRRFREDRGVYRHQTYRRRRRSRGYISEVLLVIWVVLVVVVVVLLVLVLALALVLLVVY